MSIRFEPLTARYLHVDLDGQDHRVYVEEAGNPAGVPLLCLHTAGADTRQFRGLINDDEVLATCRVITRVTSAMDSRSPIPASLVSIVTAVPPSSATPAAKDSWVRSVGLSKIRATARGPARG